MGGLTSRTEQDLKFYLQRDYDITHYPSIVHRATKKNALVHQITTDSTEQAHRIRSDVNLYKHLNCESISNILEYIPLESTKICSDQEFHYIVEEDMQKYNLKEEFFARKYYKEKFTDCQILNVIKVFLCGLNIYHSQFHRKFNGLIKFEVITVDEKKNNQLRLTDPLLMAEPKSIPSFLPHQDSSQSHNQPSYKTLILNEDHNTIREAPQKIEIRKTKFNENKVQLNELLSDIYVVGILALQLHRMMLFDKAQKHQILPTQIQSISNRQLKKIVSIMTAHHPEDRGKVYQVLKVNPQQSYFLQRNFKNGCPNKETIQSVFNTNKYSQSKEQTEPHYLNLKKQTSFSFGTSPLQMSPAFSKPLQNGGGLYSSTDFQNGSLTTGLFDKPTKHDTLSNLSTDRTIYQPTIRPLPSVQGSKQVIKFNNQSAYTTTSVSNSTIPIFASSLPNLQPIPSSQSYIATSNSALIQNKALFEQRANSFLVQDDKRPIFKEGQYSPFNKQQDISPIYSKEFSLEESNFKKIFDKHAHLNYEASSLSPNTLTENKRMEEQMNRLLKESARKPFINQSPLQPNNQANQINDLSPIGKNLNSIDSPINALETNRITTFALRQNAAKTEMQQQNQQIPVYRPNKEVEQILKRLGIGSLLYGNSESQKEELINKNDQHNEAKATENQASENDGSDIFVHKGVYNISVNPNSQISAKQSKLHDQQQNRESQDICDRQTTPIRPVQKTKYNSTIVQVGDQDSQGSSSGVRNADKTIDLSNHEYVVEQYETGSRYQGYKLNGQRDGHGKFFYQDGGYYEGQWKNNKMDGWGKLFYEGGKLAYEGNWCQDEFHGFGKVYNDNPVQLDCGFDFTNFDLLEDYWEYYEGMLVKDTKEGRGKIKLTNDQIFEGDFHNDRIQGFGKFFMKEGTMIEGIWRDSKLIKIISS